MNAYVPPHRRKNKNSNAGKQETETKTRIQQTRLYHDQARNPRHQTTNSRWGKRNRLSSSSTASHNKNNEHHRYIAEKFTRICCINLKRRRDRWETFCSRTKASLGEHSAMRNKVERFEAVDGTLIMEQRCSNNDYDFHDQEFPNLQWDATKNALYDHHIQAPMAKLMTPGEVGCAMSHVRLWKELAELDVENATMLILEDDAVFYGRKSGRKFVDAMKQVWKALPSDWDVLYLGFSDRGERHYIVTDPKGSSNSCEIHLFRPTYGFHTHAYVLKASAAQVLLGNLPVNGPLDVWLADNEWFGLNVYCSVVANEGWEGQGAWLVSQRRHDTKSDIGQSGRGLS